MAHICPNLDLHHTPCEMKKDERDLQELETNYRMILDSAGLGAWELDIVNDTAWRSLLHDQIFGYDYLLPEWGYEIFIEHVVPEDRAYVKQRFEEIGRAHV